MTLGQAMDVCVGDLARCASDERRLRGAAQGLPLTEGG